MKPPFNSPGGKARLAKTLCSMYPKHDLYIEPFAGAGSCLYAKRPSANEWLNDLDEGIVAVHTFLRDASFSMLTEWVEHKDWILSQEVYDDAILPTEDLGEKARRFMIRRKASFASQDGNITRNKIGKSLSPAKSVIGWHKRLRGVKVTQGDAHELIRQNDYSGTLFFLDPPYPKVVKQWDHYTMDTLKELLVILDGLKYADWIYAETPNIIPYVPDSWSPRYLRHIAPTYGGKRRLHEEVIYGSEVVIKQADRIGLSIEDSKP